MIQELIPYKFYGRMVEAKSKELEPPLTPEEQEKLVIRLFRAQVRARYHPEEMAFDIIHNVRARKEAKRQ